MPENDRTLTAHAYAREHAIVVPARSTVQVSADTRPLPQQARPFSRKISLARRVHS